MNLQEVSKFVALILRHKPETIGIVLDDHGYANVEELIDGVAAHYKGFNRAYLEKIVSIDEKKRYSFNQDKTLIRANQGHSIKVDIELKEQEPPEVLYHGTGGKYVKSIDKQGLRPKSRMYVHLSKDVETAKKVGQRHGTPIVYIVRAKQMYKDGYKFYLSENNVWLTNEVPNKYLER